MVLDLVQIARMIKTAPCDPYTRDRIHFHALDNRTLYRVNEGVQPKSHAHYATYVLQRVGYAYWELQGTEFTFYVEPDCSA